MHVGETSTIVGSDGRRPSTPPSLWGSQSRSGDAPSERPPSKKQKTSRKRICECAFHRSGGTYLGGNVPERIVSTNFDPKGMQANQVQLPIGLGKKGWRARYRGTSRLLHPPLSTSWFRSTVLIYPTRQGLSRCEIRERRRGHRQKWDGLTIPAQRAFGGDPDSALDPEVWHYLGPKLQENSEIVGLAARARHLALVMEDLFAKFNDLHPNYFKFKDEAAEMRYRKRLRDFMTQRTHRISDYLAQALEQGTPLTLEAPNTHPVPDRPGLDHDTIPLSHDYMKTALEPKYADKVRQLIKDWFFALYGTFAVFVSSQNTHVRTRSEAATGRKCTNDSWIYFEPVDEDRPPWIDEMPVPFLNPSKMKHWHLAMWMNHLSNQTLDETQRFAFVRHSVRVKFIGSAKPPSGQVARTDHMGDGCQPSPNVVANLTFDSPSNTMHGSANASIDGRSIDGLVNNPNPRTSVEVSPRPALLNDPSPPSPPDGTTQRLSTAQSIQGSANLDSSDERSTTAIGSCGAVGVVGTLSNGPTPITFSFAPQVSNLIIATSQFD